MKRTYILCLILLIGGLLPLISLGSEMANERYSLYSQDTITAANHNRTNEFEDLNEKIKEYKNDSKDLYFSLVYIVSFVIAATSIAVPIIINYTNNKQFQQKIDEQEKEMEKQRSNYTTEKNKIHAEHLYLIGLGLDIDLRSDERIDNFNCSDNYQTNTNLKKTYNYEEQIYYYTKAISLAQDNYLFVFRRGIAYTELANLTQNDNKKGYIDKAISDYDSAIQIIEDQEECKNSQHDADCKNDVESTNITSDNNKFNIWKIYINRSRTNRLLINNNIVKDEELEKTYDYILQDLDKSLIYSEKEKEYTSFDIIEIHLRMAEKVENNKNKEHYLDIAIKTIKDKEVEGEIKRESNLGYLKYKIANLMSNNQLVDKKKYYMKAIRHIKSALQQGEICSDFYVILAQSYFELTKIGNNNDSRFYIYAIYYFHKVHTSLISQNYNKTLFGIDLNKMYKNFIDCCIALSEKIPISSEEIENPIIKYWFIENSILKNDCLNYILDVNKMAFYNNPTNSKKRYSILENNFDNIAQAYVKRNMPCIYSRKINECENFKEACRKYIDKISDDNLDQLKSYIL